MFIFYRAFQESKVASQCNTNSKQTTSKQIQSRLLIGDKTDGDKHTLADMNQRKTNCMIYQNIQLRQSMKVELRKCRTEKTVVSIRIYWGSLKKKKGF